MLHGEFRSEILSTKTRYNATYSKTLSLLHQQSATMMKQEAVAVAPQLLRTLCKNAKKLQDRKPAIVFILFQ